MGVGGKKSGLGVHCEGVKGVGEVTEGTIWYVVRT